MHDILQPSKCVEAGAAPTPSSNVGADKEGVVTGGTGYAEEPPFTTPVKNAETFYQRYIS